jgi:hypothetical protein
MNMNSVDWTKWSAIAGVVSSFAILATLVYLAIQTQQVVTQTRQNSEAILSASRQESLNAELQVLRMIYDDPITSFEQPLQDGTIGLKQRAVDFSLFRVRELQWLQYQDGLLDEATMQSYVSILVLNIQTSDRIRRHWDAYSAAFSPGFVAQVNSMRDGALQQ